ncbi:MAG: c-type cytochrome [Phototrophicaceae bacterium]
MNRLIIESIEGRIMLGITMFISIMILVGWVAINEPARMAEFVEQHEGRSTERGAELFAANCSSCHGINGYGIGGRAPALNSPHFFGYNYIADVNNEIASNERRLLDITGTSDIIGTQELLERRQQELLDEIAASSDENPEALFIELFTVEAQLSDDLEQVAARIAAIEAGEPIGEDADPELDDDQLAARLVALQDNIPTRLAAIDAALEGEEGLYAQRDALLADLDSSILRGYFPRLEEVRVQAEEANNPLLLTTYIATDSNRLSQIEFGGALDGYITTTLIHGRPGSGDVWNGNIMVSWSQRAGGPLRDDQIGDIVAYILNWDKGDNWTADDFAAVNQYAILHQAYDPNGGGDSVDTVGVDVEAITASLPVGDATHGEELYNGSAPLEIGVVAGCSGCHLGGAVGPATMGTWTRVQSQRLTLPEFADYTAEQYLVEAIVAPNDYVAPGYASGVMNANYGEQLTAQDLADIIAYLATQTQ